MKIVLDTNVLIAALISRGVCSGLVEHCVQNHTIVASDFILNELAEKLIQKFHHSSEEAQEAIDLLRSQVEIVRPGPLESRVCRDPDDDMILATAITGAAECIVTGDNDLIVLSRYRNITILRPAEFAEFESQRPS